METAEDYLKRLYARVEPDLVVEVGADPRMTLVARTGFLVKEVAVVDFKEYNDYKEGWWEMHREMGGIDLRRVDGNACELSKLIGKADVVYLHNVVVELRRGDTEAMIKYNRGDGDLTEAQASEIEERFCEAELKVLEEACGIADHVLWFKRGEIRAQEHGRIARAFGKSLLSSRVNGSHGEFEDYEMNLSHFTPEFFDLDKDQMFFGLGGDER